MFKLSIGIKTLYQAYGKPLNPVDKSHKKEKEKKRDIYKLTQLNYNACGYWGKKK